MSIAIKVPAFMGAMGILKRRIAPTLLKTTSFGWFAGGLLLLSLGACSTLSSTPAVSVDSSRPIALLAFDNLSVTPQANTHLQRLVETRLRRAGVRNVYVYEPQQQETLNALLNPRRQLNEASRWASEQGARYAFTGTIHEWQYKSGADREPVVGVTLSLSDLRTGEVLWQANGARTGWGYANLSAVADKLVADLLNQVEFHGLPTTVSLLQGNQ